MVRLVFAFVLGSAVVRAGVVQGSVVEQASGRALARSVVRLTPIPGSKGSTEARVARASRTGVFLFASVPAGLYLLTAMRDHYFPASFGQRTARGAGVPIKVTEDSNFFTELRMRRMGAISGRVLDENGIGLSGVTVVAYRARLPLRIAGTTVSDDRGVYRVFDLAPGKYWVRSGPSVLEDGSGLLPTFGREGRHTQEAIAHAVTVGNEALDSDLRPLDGALIKIGGLVDCQPLGSAVTIQLVSETGRRTTTTRCGEGYRFENMAPGAYEIYSAVVGAQSNLGFTELSIDRDTESATVQCRVRAAMGVRVVQSGGVRAEMNAVKLRARRLDLAESGPDVELSASRALLGPGYWEFRATARSPDSYVKAIRTLWGSQAAKPWRRERAVDGFELLIQPPTELEVTIANDAGHVAGSVEENSKGVAAMPVFLWPLGTENRRSLGGFVQTLSNANGNFQFDGVPPGDYRIVATQDIDEPDAELMEGGRVPSVSVGSSSTVNLKLAPLIVDSVE